jgi:signal transduction histidine kinase
VEAIEQVIATPAPSGKPLHEAAGDAAGAGCYAERVMPESVASAAVVSRAEFDQFLHLFTHELRNRLNVLSLEAADLAEQWEGTVDLSRLQARIRECSAILKEVRVLTSPPENAHVETLSLTEIIERLRGPATT